MVLCLNMTMQLKNIFLLSQLVYALPHTNQLVSLKHVANSALWWTDYASSTVLTWLKGVPPHYLKFSSSIINADSDISANG